MQSVDALVFPEIVMRLATLDKAVIYWDGTVQNIKKADGDVNPFTEIYSGSSYALSLRIFIIDKNNQLILRNIGGIEHPYRSERDGMKGKWELRKDLLMDSEKIKHAIGVSLHPFIPYAKYPENPTFSKE